MKRASRWGIGIGILGAALGLAGCSENCSSCQVRNSDEYRPQQTSRSPTVSYRPAPAPVRDAGGTRA